MTKDSRAKRSLFETNYTMFSIFCPNSICIKNYIYIIGSLRVILDIQIEGLVWTLIRDDLRQE